MHYYFCFMEFIEMKKRMVPILLFICAIFFLSVCSQMVWLDGISNRGGPQAVHLNDGDHFQPLWGDKNE